MNIYLLSETPHEGVIHLPLIKANYLDISLELTSYEALIFSSKNGVYAIDRLDKNWKKIPSFAIGKSTALVIEELGGTLTYTAKNAYGNKFAQEITEILRGKKVAFLRPQRVLSDLEKILKNSGVDLHSHVIYETTCNDESSTYKLPKEAIFIFSSPSTIECFFKYFHWLEGFKAVFIGEVSAKAFPVKTVLHVSKKQTIADCIELAKTLIKQN